MQLLKSLTSILKSPTTARVVSTGYQAIVTNQPTQPKLGPMVAFGGSIVAGVVTMLISGYKVTDCVRYQTTQGQCDAVIERNLPGMVGGVAALFGTWGGFNTFNPKLHGTTNENGTVTPSSVVLTPKELVKKDPENDQPTNQFTVLEPHPEVIKNLHEEGNSQAKISELLGISLYAVRKALREKSEAGK